MYLPKIKDLDPIIQKAFVQAWIDYMEQEIKDCGSDDEQELMESLRVFKQWKPLELQAKKAFHNFLENYDDRNENRDELPSAIMNYVLEGMKAVLKVMQENK